MLMITTFPSRPSNSKWHCLHLEWEGLNLILKHKDMGGVLVLTVLIISSLELRDGGRKTKVNKDSILLLFYNIQLE